MGKATLNADTLYIGTLPVQLAIPETDPYADP